MLLLAATSMQAQGFLRGRFLAEGDYTRTGGLKPAAMLAVDYRTDRGHGLNSGIRVQPKHVDLNLAYQIALWENAQGGVLYAENRYLYRLFKAYGLQEFNGMLGLGYRNIHWKFQLGLCNRYTAEIPLRMDGGEGTVFEPMNVVFDLQYHLFGDDHPWNIGLGLSNQREFIIERVTLFYYTLNGYYDLNDQWRLLAETGLHPAGVLNLSAQYNGFFFNVGITYKHQ